MGWDRHKLLWDGNGTNKYVPSTTLIFAPTTLDFYKLDLCNTVLSR